MKRKILYTLLILTGLIFSVPEFYKNFRFRCDYFYAALHGKITDLKYDQQEKISIKINNREWLHLGTNINYNVKIEIGDSIVKKSMDFNTLIIKNRKIYNLKPNLKIFPFLKYCKCIEE